MIGKDKNTYATDTPIGIGSVSPEQISAWAKKSYPKEKQLRRWQNPILFIINQ